MNFQKLKEYTLEILLAFIAIVLSVFLDFKDVSNTTEFIVTAFVVLVSASIAITKEHISKTSEKAILSLRNEISKYIKTTQYLADLDGVAYNHAKNNMDEAIQKIREIKEGKIFLEQETYYEHLNDCMKTISKGSEIIAINSIDSIRWSNDSNQIRYFEENIKAAERGVKIHRIFIISKENLKDSERMNNIKLHINQKNIEVDIVVSDELIGFKSELEDIVIFNCSSEKRLYIDYPDNSNRTNILYAYLFLSQREIENRIKVYKKLQNYAIPKSKLNKLFNNEK